MDKDNKTSIFSYIGKILLFIILLPFNIVKSINLGVNKLMKKDTHSTKEKVDLSKNIRDEEVKSETLKFKNDESSDNAKEFIITKEEHKKAKEEMKKEKLRQKELQKQNKKSLFQKIKEKNIFEKNKRQDRKKQIVALDINSEDAKRSTEKLIFKYSALNPEGKIEKGSFLGYSKLDVHSYLLSEGYKVYEIKAVAKANMFNTDIALNRPMKKSILVFYLTQLSTYLKAGIPIVDSIKILSTQSKTESDKTIWKSVVYELSMGATLSEAMIRMGVIFPKLLINMVKAAEISHRIMDENNRKLRKINDYMTDRILNEIDDCICNGNRENRLSNNINVSFGNIDGKALLVLLDMEGVYVSGASACNGGKEKSYVLSSLGVPEKYAEGTIRMTMDYTMNMKQADYVLNVLKKCVNYLRKK